MKPPAEPPNVFGCELALSVENFRDDAGRPEDIEQVFLLQVVRFHHPLPVFLAEDPLSSVVIGAGKALETLDILRQVCQPG